jgi:dienelactone hydrolase
VWDTSKPARGLMVQADDAEVIGKAYREMLGKLLQAAPNIDPARSVIGGFSNGAHTTGALLANRDEFLLKHFSNFVLLEGGFNLLTEEVLAADAVKGHRFITLRGDRGRPADGKSPFADRLAKQEDVARREKLDFTPVVMRGYGHEQPGPYLKLIGEWARGEKLTEVPPKPEVLKP